MYSFCWFFGPFWGCRSRPSRSCLAKGKYLQAWDYPFFLQLDSVVERAFRGLAWFEEGIFFSRVLSWLSRLLSQLQVLKDKYLQDMKELFGMLTQRSTMVSLLWFQNCRDCVADLVWVVSWFREDWKWWWFCCVPLLVNPRSLRKFLDVTANASRAAAKA